jgi:hypothetical protein
MMVMSLIAREKVTAPYPTVRFKADAKLDQLQVSALALDGVAELMYLTMIDIAVKARGSGANIYSG